MIYISRLALKFMVILLYYWQNDVVYDFSVLIKKISHDCVEFWRQTVVVDPDGCVNLLYLASRSRMCHDGNCLAVVALTPV